MENNNENYGKANTENLSYEDLLLEIQKLEFATVDLNLFLDTHPDNQMALNDYNMYTVELSKLKKEYRLRFGPFANFGSAPSKYPWQWVESPWPWEV
ncbi:MAG TPA: spore coat protein CotJB [Clostridiales bacterium]|nr:MAG: spore coat protein CotJB [Clostridiales bacterium GWD2_32_59]HAN09530.1 spore coat protein CotJB [Clostridiales bacterium]